MSTSLMQVYGITARPTSFGVSVTNTQGATASAGRVIIAKGGPVTGPTTDISPGNFTSWETHPLVHGGEWHTVGAPRSAQAYDPLTVASATNVTAGPNTWDNIYIAIFGSTVSATVAQVDIVLNYEYFVAEDAVIAQLATKQPIYSAPMISAINEVQSNHLASHKGTQAAVSAFVKKEGKKALLKHVLPFLAKKAVLALA